MSIPAFAFSHMELVKSHSFMDLQLSDSENHYPILLFSHGFNGFRNQNTFQVEELASQGYIVLSIDHTFDAAATVFPGGRTAYVQPINLTDEGDSHIKLWEEDVSFVLNQIEKLNENDETGFFTGRLDTSRIGMFGHSTVELPQHKYLQKILVSKQLSIWMVHCMVKSCLKVALENHFCS